MDLVALVNDAWEYLLPFYNTQEDEKAKVQESYREMIASLDEDERASVQQGEVGCVVSWAGNTAGNFLYLAHNNGKYWDWHEQGGNEEPLIDSLIPNVGTTYAALIYHVQKCRIKHDDELTTMLIQSQFREFLRWNEAQKRSNDPFTITKGIVSEGDISDTFAHILHLKFGPQKLGNYARMTPPEAFKFLKEIASEGIRDN